MWCRTSSSVGTDRPLETGLPGDDVGSATGLDPADRHHGRMEWVDLPRDQSLDGSNQESGHHNGVGGFVRPCTMPGLTAYIDAEAIRLRRHDAVADHDRPRLPLVCDVAREDRCHTLEGTVGDRRSRSSTLLFGWLEDQRHPAGRVGLRSAAPPRRAPSPCGHRGRMRERGPRRWTSRAPLSSPSPAGHPFRREGRFRDPRLPRECR